MSDQLYNHAPQIHLCPPYILVAHRYLHGCELCGQGFAKDMVSNPPGLLCLRHFQAGLGLPKPSQVFRPDLLLERRRDARQSEPALTIQRPKCVDMIRGSALVHTGRKSEETRHL